jgi:hypothetical protein
MHDRRWNAMSFEASRRHEIGELERGGMADDKVLLLCNGRVPGVASRRRRPSVEKVFGGVWRAMHVSRPTCFAYHHAKGLFHFTSHQLDPLHEIANPPLLEYRIGQTKKDSILENSNQEDMDQQKQIQSLSNEYQSLQSGECSHLDHVDRRRANFLQI